MKILYISNGTQIDYQNDSLFLGLKELFGSDVVDVPKRTHSYKSFDQELVPRCYGMGMSVTRILDDLDVDRDDIDNKIKNKYFDLVVYGSIYRSSDYLDTVLTYYPPEKIAAIDGEDHLGIHPVYEKGVKYFKRELIDDRGSIFPISFAIPESKINFNVEKTRDIAFCDPNDITTYIYKTEETYYNGYGESRLAHTKKKAGWDCMRHYEIMANGCIPLFENIEDCPTLTMVGFPKILCANVYKEFSSGVEIDKIYEKYYIDLRENINLFTTKTLAENFISTMINH